MNGEHTKPREALSEEQCRYCGGAHQSHEHFAPKIGAALERAIEALTEFRQQDDFLLSPGASLMSDDSHQIIHVDTLRRIVAAVLNGGDPS